MDDVSAPDLVVYGSTAPGIVAAVRAAREGLSVALVTAGDYLGGSFPSLGAVESHYRGVRAPLLQEFIERICAYYGRTYGENSAQFRTCTGGTMTTFEPHIAESILRDWVSAEPRIRWLPGWTPIAVERAGTVIRAINFRASGGGTLRLAGGAFVEAGDEGDIMALAGAEHRVGREARAKFGEPRAGRVFTRWLTGEHPRAAAEGRLNLITARATTSEPLFGSTGEGDDNVQSYSYRLCLTDDPANRRMFASPPPGYDRTRYAPVLLSPAEKDRLALPFHHRFLIYDLLEMVERDHIIHGHALPNRKRSWNATNLTGAGKRYASASPAARREIERQHREHALGLLYFLQNDPAVPGDIRDRARAWGLARDEFVASDNFPPLLYVREARRLAGRATFTEHDALSSLPAAPCHSIDDKSERRAPVHADSIGITEFSLDSLACTMERLPGAGALCDGQLFQMEASRPGQVPFGVLVPREIDNLLVVTTVSASHVGWGTVRQTPTQMHLAESAAWAVVLAARERVAPANVNVEALQRLLVEHGVMITFFNDCDMATPSPWVPAVQFCGARGFFPTYDAGAEDVIDEATAASWARAAGVGVADLRGLTRGEACLRCYRLRNR